MKKPDDALFWEFLDNLSPFKTKYFYPIACFIFILIAITFPPANYDGFLSVSSSSKVQNSHRVLFDATFISCIYTLIFLFIKYKIMGLDPKYQKKLEAYSLEIYRYSKFKKPDYTPKKSIIISFIVTGVIIGIFFIPPMREFHIKHDWMYQGNVYISFIGMYFIFLGAFSGVLLSILSTEVHRNAS